MKKIFNIMLILSGVLLFTVKSGPVSASSSRTEQITYQTTYQNKKYQKQALVYLPAGYDENKRYDIIYLLHGSTDSARAFYQNGNFKRVFDRLAKKEKLTDTIAVFPTYYPDDSFVTADYFQDDPLNKAFAQNELLNDLIPAVEGKYSTYAKDTTKKQLRSSRDHRAFGGFSMGAITTWYVFEKQLPYFTTYLPVAGDSWTVSENGGEDNATKTAKKLARSVAKEPKLKYQLLAGVGENDGTGSAMNSQMTAMRKLKAFDRENLRYYQVENEGHTIEATVKSLEHYASKIFK